MTRRPHGPGRFRVSRFGMSRFRVSRFGTGRFRVSRFQLGRLLRFAVVGGVNTLTFYACYLALHPWMPYFAAYTIAFLFSMVGSFFLNTYFTYRTRPSWKKFLLFPLTQVTNYLVQSAGLVALVSWCGLGTRVAPLVAAVIAIPFTYLVSTRILVPGKPVPVRDRESRTGDATAGRSVDHTADRTGDEVQPARSAGPV
ncbi:GtrA family protein [Streptomyces sp. NPDC059788]|uniref:GtrA family protein n=1 Tax=Streptomyces sp. NPDC059788 TaxID=3346948 RepID=UPI00364D74E4